MRIQTHALLLGALCFLPPLRSSPSVSAFDAAQDPETGRPTLTDREQKSADAMIAKMQGLWRVTEIRTPAVDSHRREEAGYLLVGGMTFSLEVHWGDVGPDSKTIVDKNFQSGTHRFELDDSGAMVTKTVIGSFFNDVGLLQWEEPNKSRRYQVVLAATQMTWTNDEGNTFVFQKLDEPTRVRRDVFGRPVPDKKKDPKGEKPPK